MLLMSGISRCLPGRGGLSQVIISEILLDILCVPNFSCTTLQKNGGEVRLEQTAIRQSSRIFA